MKIWMLFFVVFVLYLFNQISFLKVKQKYGESEFSEKMFSNTKNISSCTIGIILMIVSQYFLGFIKWPLIIFYSLAFAWEFIIAFLISFVLQIVLILKRDTIEKESWYAILSNFVSSMCYGIMAYSIYYFLF